MTLSEFEKRHALGAVKVLIIDGHLYTEPLGIKLDINKNITENDFKNNKNNLSIIKYLDGFVMTKDGTTRPHGLKLEGEWSAGFALDLHTISSTQTGMLEGAPSFENKRTPMAEDLYRFKYKMEYDRLEVIAAAAVDFISFHEWPFDVIIPTPPSDTNRDYQPVDELANALADQLGIRLFAIRKIAATPELKTVSDPKARRMLLKNAFAINDKALFGKKALIFDDIYRSGETLCAVHDVVKNKGKADEVYALTITKTRSKR